MKTSLIAPVLLLIPFSGFCASAGPEALKEPPAPVKKVEEPVFKLPELVIIGENQARIMAQKEQLAGTPLMGLHEAPLLEKEESALTQLRRRELIPVREPAEDGPFALLKAEGGSAAFYGAGLAAGRRKDDFCLGVDVSGSRWKGAPAGGGHAGGWEFSALAGRSSLISEPEKLDSLVPSWFRFFAPWGIPDWNSGWLGWQGMGRDLPYLGNASRRAGRFCAAGDTSRGSNGFSNSRSVQYLTVSSPVADRSGWSLIDSWRVPVADFGPVSFVSDLRAGYEGLHDSGKYIMGGAGVSAVVTGVERWKYSIGFAADGVRSGGEFSGSLRPFIGASFASSDGFNVSSLYSGGLSVPSLAGQVFESPYACFTRMPAAERNLGGISLSLWKTIWDESGFGADYGYSETRNALTWFERPGEGLYDPASLSRLRIHEFRLGGRWNGFEPWKFSAEGTWRAVSAEGGEAANLPRGSGKAAAEWDWNELSSGAEIEVVRKRFRSLTGGELDPFVNLAMKASWEPIPALKIFARADNLLGDDVERWGGYPDPKRFLSAGLLAYF